MAGFNIVGVQFRRAGKIYDFDAKDFPIAVGDRVVVETERGPSLAEVKRISFVPESAVNNADSLKPIVRLASGKDQDITGRINSDQALVFTKTKIKDLNLDMRVINVEIQFGGNKVIVYFSAPGRVDFRELVKELAGGLKTRVELKQVGARDEAKLSGGIGICGREFCCSSFLREFVPVSIKMAKNQNLALNPSKVSGGCGRLLCCLTYEDETYSALRKQLLPKGARVKLLDNTFGDVVRGDILNQVMQVELDSGELKNVPIRELEIVDAKQGMAQDDWGSDLDFGSLMGEGGDLGALDDSEEVSRHRESASDMPAQNAKGPRPQGQDRRPARGPQPNSEGQRGRGPRPQRSEGGGGGRPQGDAQARGPRPDRGQGPRDNRDGGQPREGREGGPNREGNRQQNRGRPDNRGPRPEGERQPRQEGERGPRPPRSDGGGRPQGEARGRGDGSNRNRDNRGQRPPREGGDNQRPPRDDRGPREGGENQRQPRADQTPGTKSDKKE